MTARTRLMAMYDGELSPADVINVAKKRIAATVNLRVNVLKAKLMPMITKTPKLPMRVDFSGEKPGLRVQAKADGVWYAEEQTMKNAI